MEAPVAFFIEFEPSEKSIYKSLVKDSFVDRRVAAGKSTYSKVLKVALCLLTSIKIQVKLWTMYPFRRYLHGLQRG